jgi:hypothetical protein
VARGYEKCNVGEKGATRKRDVVEKEQEGDEKKATARRQKRAEYFLCLIFFCQYTNCRGNKGRKKGKKWEGKDGGKGGRPGMVASERTGLLDQTMTTEQRNEK